MPETRSADDTIAAIATGAGIGGIGVLRLSGPLSRVIARQLGCKQLPPRSAEFVRLRDRQGGLLDEAIVISYPGPHSFTGEDVVELQCHGSPVLLRRLLSECIALGARAAGPGEFSQRAFLNDKIDLLQAEAIADLISSRSEAAARSALRTLTGEFSERVSDLLRELIELRVYIEAAIDFPEEEVDFIADSDVLQRLTALQRRLADTQRAARRGQVLHDGMKLVLAGSPNVGKSSLLNRLVEADSAIVTEIPGTTRDPLREQIHLDGIPVHIVDTAGLRDSTDPVEAEGIRRARREIDSADRILLVIDDSQPPADMGRERDHYALPATLPITLIHNKCDLTGAQPRCLENGDLTQLWLSARSGAGIDLLRGHLLACAGFNTAPDGDFSARERHVEALKATSCSVDAALGQLQDRGAAELVAEELRYAQDHLGSITGAFTSDDLLGAIFSSFCIGK